MPATEDTEIFQHYRLLRREDGSLWKLGAGGMGATYKAIDTELGRPAALKVIHAEWLGRDAFARERFVREAKAAASLNHPNVATVYHFGQEGGRFFYAMEFIDGETVEERVRRRGPLPEAEALDLALQVAGALSAAHQLGLVHRDLKPANLMLLADGRGGREAVKLIDFGLARSVLETAPAPDSGGGSGGGQRSLAVFTPLYASPEQCQEQPADIRGDIYSLGVTLWFMLTGRPTFQGDSAFELQSRHVSAPPPLETLAAAGVSDPVRRLLARMLAKNPADRPQTPAELQREIEACLPPGFSSRPATTAGLAGARVPPDEAKTDLQAAAAAPSPALDENVQFTAYRPKIVRPGKWTRLLVFAHLDERPEWMDEDERAPLEEMEAQAAQILGPRLADYRHTTDDSRLAVPREGEITLAPVMAGVEFNPPRRAFFWKDGVSVHGETFDLRAAAALDGQVARGRLTIFLGALILAEISLSIRVDSRHGATRPAAAAAAAPARERSSARPFRRIFASYSHRDLEIVEVMERHARSLGDEYLRDWLHLRSGEFWSDRLEEMIREADVFQLFWSWNSARSEYVAHEWRYALGLNRDAFVRPTYWQDPMPEPPEPLRRIHFHRLAAAVPPGPAAAMASSQAATVPSPATEMAAPAAPPARPRPDETTLAPPAGAFPPPPPPAPPMMAASAPSLPPVPAIPVLPPAGSRRGSPWKISAISALASIFLLSAIVFSTYRVGSSRSHGGDGAAGVPPRQYPNVYFPPPVPAGTPLARPIPTPAPPPGRLTEQEKSRVRQLLAEARQADAAGRRAEAIEKYAEALALAPNYARGQAAPGPGDAFTAPSVLRQVIAGQDRRIETNPRDARAYFDRANANLLLQRPDRSLADYDAAFRLDPGLTAARQQGDALRRAMDRARNLGEN